jgi:hypothetical protein
MMNFRSHNPLLVLQSCQPWWRLLQDILQVSCGKSKGCLGATDGDDFVLLWLNTRCCKRCYSRQEWCNLKQRSPCGGPKPQQPLHRWSLRFPTSNRVPYSYAPSSRQDDCSRETWFKLLERRRSRTGISSFSSSTPWVSSKTFLSVDRQSEKFSRLDKFVLITLSDASLEWLLEVQIARKMKECNPPSASGAHNHSNWCMNHWQGSSDLSLLSEKGKAQAQRVREAIMHMKFEKCFASPISRAKVNRVIIIIYTRPCFFPQSPNIPSPLSLMSLLPSCYVQTGSTFMWWEC